MPQDTTKPKTLTIGKPLSLTKQVEIANTMEIAKGIISPTKPNPKSQDIASSKDQTLPSSHKDKQKELKTTTDQKQESPQKDVSKGKESKPPVDAVDEKEVNQAALDKAAKREALKQRFARIKQALAWLCETYPNCFNAKDPKPLKIGITKDILDAMKREPSDHPSILSIRQAIHHYTCNLLYHQAMLSNAHRIDLDGNTADEITDQARTYAQGWIEVKELAKQKWQEKQKEKKKEKKKPDSDPVLSEEGSSTSESSKI